MLGRRLDDYERRARLLPALLAGLPVVGLLVALGIREYTIVTSIGALVVSAGGPVVVATLVRDLGKDLEADLWQRWGGPPTTQLLRTNGPEPGRRARRRALIERLTGEPLPTAEDERDDPNGADVRYEQAVAEARAATRLREQHPIVHAENVAYGFARHTLALRPLGIWASAVSLAAAVAAAGIQVVVGDMPYGLLELGAAGALAGAMLLFWAWYPTETRVREAAERYAAQLLDAVAEVVRPE